MTESSSPYDVAIIGGGLYGLFAATQIALKYPMLSIVVVEKEKAPFMRASSTNQGQLHMGYVYSNDPELAGDCQREAPLFKEYFSDAVDLLTDSHYGIHKDSEISIEDYEKFCTEVGLPLTPIDKVDNNIVSEDIVSLYKTPEKTFNPKKIEEKLLAEVHNTNVKLLLESAVQSVRQLEDKSHELVIKGNPSVQARIVINACFADINRLHDDSNLPRVSLRSDVFLHFLVTLPLEYKHTAISIIRGEYCFLIPSSFRGGHLLASARYRCTQSSTTNYVSEKISNEEIKERYKLTIEQCSTFVPILKEASYKGYTIGTRVAYYDPKEDTYSSKVVFLENYNAIPGYHILVGGKVSAIFDALEPTLSAIENSDLPI